MTSKQKNETTGDVDGFKFRPGRGQVERPEDMFHREIEDTVGALAGTSKSSGSGAAKGAGAKKTSVEERRDRRFSAMKKSGDYMNIFVCFQCRDSLFGKRFVKIERKPWCVTCYNKNFTTICTLCTGQINVDSEDILYGNSHWHLSCFKCSSCEVSLFQKTFGATQDNILFCSDCYFRMHKKWCVHCDKPFKGGQKMVTFREELYHKECFACSSCHTLLQVDQFRCHGDDRYCGPCFAKIFAPHCSECGDIIAEQKEGVQHKGRDYHRGCLKCATCEGQLADQRYYNFKDQLHCYSCFESERVMGKKCVQCGLSVSDSIATPTPTTTGEHEGEGEELRSRFYSVDYDSFWHPRCFNCTRCLQPLDPDESFVCPPSNIEGAEGDHASPQAYCKPCGLENIVDVQALVFAKFEVPDLE